MGKLKKRCFYSSKDAKELAFELNKNIFTQVFKEILKENSMSRPAKYGEKTIAFPVKIPISRQKEAKEAIWKALEKFKQPKDKFQHTKKN